MEFFSTMKITCTIFILATITGLSLLDNPSSASTRLKVIDCGGAGDEIVVWFSVKEIFWKYSFGNSPWTQISFPSEIKAASNPAACCFSNTTGGILLVQDIYGQVYASFFNQNKKTVSFGAWNVLGSKLPYDEGYIAKSGDGIISQKVEDSVNIFARSFTNSSSLYWLTLNTATKETSPWKKVCGDDVSLMTDASVAFNSFTNLLEAFMVSSDKYLYRCWQTSSDEWSTWDKTGYSAPTTVHTPVVHAMDTNVFNGRLNVFIHGSDNKLHHIWQTTCDKVPNPWGWCTWSLWYSIGDEIPPLIDVTNSLTVGQNLHHGIEIFVVSSKGSIHKLWQLDRHKKWSNWEKVYSNADYSMTSSPTISNAMLWWKVYGLDNETNLLAITQNHTFTLNPSSIRFSSLTTVFWSVPIDEATNKDWIAIYQSESESNEAYLDYSYVGGSQNPLSEPVPKGHVTFSVYLPQGSYDVKYLVDKQYVSAASTKLIVTSSSTEKEWVQIFRGIFLGLNIYNVSVEQCVKDAKSILDAFEKAFKEFNDRFIYTGLYDLGDAVSLVLKGVKDCGIEKAFIDRIEVFVKDLIACAQKKKCTRFVVDIGKEVLVLYENIYEIYSDIRAASNCFKIKAYSQGAYNIGRVIGACIALPR